MNCNRPAPQPGKTNMLRHWLSAFALLIVCSASAQDTIFYKDGTLRFARILEINGQQIRFKNPDNPDGPDYVIHARDVNRIGYKNGTSDTFGNTGSKNSNPAEKEIPAEPSRRNYLSLNAIDLMPGLVTISYERTFKDPRFTFEAALSSGIRSWSYKGRFENGVGMKYFASNKPIGLTSSFLFYPKGLSRTANFGVGPELGAGLFYKNSYDWYILPYPYPYPTEIKGAGYYTFALSFNCKVIPADMLFIHFTGAIGTQFRETDWYYTTNQQLQISPYARLGVNVGLRF